MTLCITALGIFGLIATLVRTFLLLCLATLYYYYVECHYAECRHADCHHDECRGAIKRYWSIGSIMLFEQNF
jgi:hypothetical protein